MHDGKGNMSRIHLRLPACSFALKISPSSFHSKMNIQREGKLVGQLGLAAWSGAFTLEWVARTMHEGPLRKVVWNKREDRYTVLDGEGTKLAWTEFRPKQGYFVVLADGSTLPNFWIQRTWYRRYHRIWLDEIAFRPVMMLEGRVRVFGNDRLRVEHRDYKSEVIYTCDPELEMAALVVSFLLWNTPNCNARPSDSKGA